MKKLLTTTGLIIKHIKKQLKEALEIITSKKHIDSYTFNMSCVFLFIFNALLLILIYSTYAVMAKFIN